MKTRILKGWNGLRMLRLLAGLAITVQGVISTDWFFIMGGALLTALPIFNAGCCTTYGCGYNATVENTTTKETTYEEVV